MTDSDTEEMPTTMYLQQPVKDRFDTHKREVEAEEDQDMTNSAVLARLLDATEERDDQGDGAEAADSPEPVTICEDCGEMWAGRTTYCDDCGSEKIRQVEPREQDESEWSA